MSGLSRTPGKRVWANPHRGFESRPLRQNTRLHAVFKKFSFLTHQLTSQKQKCCKSPLTSGLFLFSPSMRAGTSSVLLASGVDFNSPGTANGTRGGTTHTPVAFTSS